MFLSTCLPSESSGSLDRVQVKKKKNRVEWKDSKAKEITDITGSGSQPNLFLHEPRRGRTFFGERKGKKVPIEMTTHVSSVFLPLLPVQSSKLS